MAQRREGTSATGDTAVGSSSDEDTSSLAIHNRPQRVRRVAQDYLVENAAFYDVHRLYRNKKRRREGEEEATEPPATSPGPVVANEGERRSSSRCAAAHRSPAPSHSPAAPRSRSNDVHPIPAEAGPSVPHTATPDASPSPPHPTKYATPKKAVQSTELLRSAPVSQMATPKRSTPPPATPTPRKGSLPTAPPLPIDDDTMLELMLSTLSGRQASVRILAGRSVGLLAARVEALLGIPREQVRFKHNGVDIPLTAVNQSLKSVGVRSGESLLIRMEGAASSVGPPASPFKDRVSLFAQGTPKKVLPPSPYKDIPAWMRD